MVARIEYRPGGVGSLWAAAVAYVVAAWRALFAPRSRDGGIDWEDGESS